MIRTGTARALSAASVAACLLAVAGSAQAAPPVTATVFAKGSDVNATAPDSITTDGTHVFVEYSNGASATLPPGQDGSSTIAEYDLSGKVLTTYSVPGSADGLRYNAATNQLWVLQNQDNNSALTTIDTSGVMTHYTYASPLAGRGLDDVAFVGGNAYMSATNPPGASNPTSPVIYQATLGAGTVNLTPVLAFNATGTNTATGQAGQPIVANDPDSLTLRPDGSLLLTSEADGALTTVSKPGVGQTVSFVNLVDATGKSVTGLDDTVFPTSSDQRLLVADTANNTVYSLTGPFQVGGAYASLSGTNSVDLINLTTGVSTPITSGLFAANASPHGLLFVPAAVPEPSPLLLAALTAGLGFGYHRIRGKRNAV